MSAVKNIANLNKWSQGPTTATAGSVMKIDNLFEDSQFKLKDEAGIWAGATYASYAISKEITNTTVTGLGDGPLTSLFVYANNNGVPQPAAVVGLIASSIARVSNGAVFGANILARNSPGNTNTKLVGLEIDVQPTAGTTVSTTSAGMFINAFNVNMNCPAIQIGGLSGSFSAGLVIDGVTIAGVSPNAGTTMGALINTGIATYTDGAIVVSNEHKLVFKGSGVGKSPGFIYNDFADNVRLVLGDNNFFVIRNKANTSSLIGFLDVGGQAVINMETSGAEFRIFNTRVVGARDTGWSAMIGTANKNTAYDTTTVTLQQLAGRVMALQAALTAHGLIGV